MDLLEQRADELRPSEDTMYIHQDVRYLGVAWRSERWLINWPLDEGSRHPLLEAFDRHLFGLKLQTKSRLRLRPAERGDFSRWFPQRPPNQALQLTEGSACAAALGR